MTDRPKNTDLLIQRPWKISMFERRKAVEEMLYRAQLAEAECERMRERVNEIANDFVPFPGQEGLALDEMREALTALATPPPECEPEPDAVLGMRAIGQQFRGTPPAPEQTSYCPRCTQEMDRYSVTHCPSCDVSVGGAPPSEQAHGDALAAFERLAGGFSSTVERDKEIVRKSLTDSGVPEEIRALSFWQGFGERAVTILHNMAQENSGRFRIRRWPISDEPLRNDAARLLREYGLGRIMPADRQYVGDAAAPTDGRE